MPQWLFMYVSPFAVNKVDNILPDLNYFPPKDAASLQKTQQL